MGSNCCCSKAQPEATNTVRRKDDGIGLEVSISHYYIDKTTQEIIYKITVEYKNDILLVRAHYADLFDLRQNIDNIYISPYSLPSYVSLYNIEDVDETMEVIEVLLKDLCKQPQLLGKNGSLYKFLHLKEINFELKNTNKINKNEIINNNKLNNKSIDERQPLVVPDDVKDDKKDDEKDDEKDDVKEDIEDGYRFYVGHSKIANNKQMFRFGITKTVSFDIRHVWRSIDDIYSLNDDLVKNYGVENVLPSKSELSTCKVNEWIDKAIGNRVTLRNLPKPVIKCFELVLPSKYKKYNIE